MILSLFFTDFIDVTIICVFLIKHMVDTFPVPLVDFWLPFMIEVHRKPLITISDIK